MLFNEHCLQDNSMHGLCMSSDQHMQSPFVAVAMGCADVLHTASPTDLINGHHTGLYTSLNAITSETQ